ncbi:hypothetical protein TWF281_008574 [Arthrobotrys megalospora]
MDQPLNPATHRVPMLQVSPPTIDSTAEVEAASVPLNECPVYSLLDTPETNHSTQNPTRQTKIQQTRSDENIPIFTIPQDENRQLDQPSAIQSEGTPNYSIQETASDREVGRASMEITVGQHVQMTESTIEHPEMSITDEKADIQINEKCQDEFRLTGSYAGRSEAVGFTLDNQICLETPSQPQEEEDRDLLQNPDDSQDPEDDSGYGTTRKRIRISVDKYMARKTPRQCPGGDHLAFDRISPNSKYYKTTFVPSGKPVNRVLFPSAAKKRNVEAKSQEQEKIQPEEDDDLSDDVAVPEAQEEPKDIYDPLSPYRHAWTDPDLVRLYVLRRW